MYTLIIVNCKPLFNKINKTRMGGISYSNNWDKKKDNLFLSVLCLFIDEKWLFSDIITWWRK